MWIYDTLADLMQVEFQLWVPIYYYFAVLVTVWAIKQMNDSKTQTKMKAYAEMIGVERDRYIIELKNSLPEIDLTSQQSQKIIRSDITELKQMLKKGETTSVQLLNLFSLRSFTLGIKNQWITDSNYHDALNIAKHHDEQRKQNPNQCQGPLHGIPISIQDNIMVQGLPSTLGCVSKIRNVPEEDGLTCFLIQEAGGIPFVKTNVPQCCMTFETYNRMYGRAKNPWDETRSCAGSSGGQAGLIAAGCSPAGLGTDIGGSIRMPASFTGIVGFKPTKGRLSNKGYAYYSPFTNGQNIVESTIGPMAKSVGDCALIMESLLLKDYHKKAPVTIKDGRFNFKQFDQKQFQDTIQQKRLRFGYFKSLDYYPACEASQRAVQQTVDEMKKLGHQVIEVSLPDANQVFFSMYEVLGADQMRGHLSVTGGQELIQQYALQYLGTKVPHYLHKVLKVIMDLIGFGRTAKLLNLTNSQQTAPDMFRLSDQIIKLRKQFCCFFIQNQLDALICPGSPAPALLLGTANQNSLAPIYSFLFNVLNCPAGTLPVTVVKDSEMHYNQKYRDMFARNMRKCMEKSSGLPISVQVITLPFEEEKCLGVMAIIEKSFQFRHKFVCPLLSH